MLLSILCIIYVGNLVAGHNKTKTVPFRLLTYFLYGKFEWIDTIAPGVVRISTGAAARALRVRNADLWEYLYWLEQMKLVKKVSKEKKRGTVILHLIEPHVFEDMDE